MVMAKKRKYMQKRINEFERHQLISDYVSYVKRIVSRIASNLPPDVVEESDLVNAGIIGLIEAVDNYDASRKNKFLTYAIYRIKGAVLSELRARDFIGRSARKKLREVENTSLLLEKKYGRKIKDEEIAEKMELKLEDIHKIKSVSNIAFVNLEELNYSKPEEKENIINFLGKNNIDDASVLTRLREVKDAIAKGIEQLPENEKMVLSLYYTEELTMKETGEVMNISESRVSQIHSKAIIHLRKFLIKKGLIDTSN